LGDENKELYPEALNLFSHYYERHMLDTTGPYHGIREVLNHFSEKRKIVLTNKLVFFAEKILEALTLSRYFMEIIGGDSNSFRKPDPGVLLPVIERYALKKEKVVMIGDGVNDLLLARNTGVISCAFLNGLTERNRLMDLSPDFIYENPEELIHLFQ
jgi:phosphoglycolate phosphatase